MYHNKNKCFSSNN